MDFMCTNRTVKKKNIGEDVQNVTAIYNMKNKHMRSTIQFHFYSNHHIYDSNTQKNCLTHIAADKAYLLEK